MNLPRTRVGIVLLFFSCSPDSYAQLAGDVTEQVIAAWEKRQAITQTIDIRWRGQDTILAGSRRMRRRPRSPKKDETRDTAGRFVWDTENELVRFEIDKYLPNEEGGMSRYLSVNVYNGFRFKRYIFQSQLRKLGSPPGVSAWKSTTYSQAVAYLRCLPVRLIYGGLDRIKDSYQVADPMFSVVREETIDGRDCVVLRLKPTKVRFHGPDKTRVLLPPRHTEEIYWLDKQWDFLPVRFTTAGRIGGPLSVQVDFQYEERKGQFVPATWRIANDFNDEGKPALVAHAFVVDLAINEAIPLEQFQFNGYPKGMYILDDESSPRSLPDGK